MVKVSASMHRDFRSRAGVACVAAAALLSCSAFGEAHAQSDSLVPGWVKNVFGLYVDGDLPEDQFLTAITYLIDNGIMRVSASGIADEGDFDVEYGPNPNSPRTWGYSAAEYLQDKNLLEDNAEWLNNTYKLPYPVKILGKECGELNAFYIPSEKSIEICYEYVDFFLNMGYELYDNSTYAEDFAYNVLDDTLLHETGHALVDIYDLPITGMEEDAVDQFAALIQSRTYTDYGFDYEADYTAGRDRMLDVAKSWEQMAQTEQPQYWNKHSLSIQRFYNSACYAYGADPVYNSFLADEYLPPERAETCERDYDQMSSSWDRLLEGYMIE